MSAPGHSRRFCPAQPKSAHSPKASTEADMTLRKVRARTGLRIREPSLRRTTSDIEISRVETRGSDWLFSGRRPLLFDRGDQRTRRKAAEAWSISPENGNAPRRRDWLAGAGGFEPPNGGIKIRCLTTWLRPKTPSDGRERRAVATGPSPHPGGGAHHNDAPPWDQRHSGRRCYGPPYTIMCPGSMNCRSGPRFLPGPDARLPAE